jgi:hypothetical protein
MKILHFFWDHFCPPGNGFGSSRQNQCRSGTGSRATTPRIKLALLIAVSFPAMFEHDMEEKKNSRVEVKDVEADVMADMLRYADMHRYADMLIAQVCRRAQICRHAQLC